MQTERCATMDIAIDTKSRVTLFGNQKYDVALLNDENDIMCDWEIIVNEISMYTISWIVPSERIEQLWEYATSGTLTYDRCVRRVKISESSLPQTFGHNFTQDFRNHHKHFITVDEIDRMVEFSNKGLSKEMAFYLAMIDYQSDALSFDDIAELASQGVAIQMEDNTRLSTLEILFYMNARIDSKKIVKNLLLDRGKTFFQQKNLYAEIKKISSDYLDLIEPDFSSYSFYLMQRYSDFFDDDRNVGKEYLNTMVLRTVSSCDKEDMKTLETYKKFFCNKEYNPRKFISPGNEERHKEYNNAVTLKSDSENADWDDVRNVVNILSDFCNAYLENFDLRDRSEDRKNKYFDYTSFLFAVILQKYSANDLLDVFEDYYDVIKNTSNDYKIFPIKYSMPHFVVMLVNHIDEGNNISPSILWDMEGI